MIRNICYTAFEGQKAPCMSDPGISYLVEGAEICPTTGKFHLQGYLELDSPVRFTTLQRRWPGVHLESRKGSQQQAIDYCKKDGKWMEYGDPKQQGKRKDIDDLIEAVNEGIPMSEIAKSAPGTFIKIHKGLGAYRFAIQGDRTEKPFVEWRWGPTGTGKTRGAFEKHADSIFIKDGTPWWDGYENQRAVLIDDFDGKWPYRDLLRLLDRYPYQGQIKGGYVKMNSPFIYITCEHPPSHFWSGNELAQVARRLDHVTYVTKVTEVGGNTSTDFPRLERQAACYLDLGEDAGRQFLIEAHDDLDFSI